MLEKHNCFAIDLKSCDTNNKLIIRIHYYTKIMMANNNKLIIFLTYFMMSTTTMHNLKLKFKLVYGETKTQTILRSKLNKMA